MAPPQPTNDGQHPWMDTGDTDRRRGTRMMMRDKGRQWLSSSSSFYISYCKYPLPLSSLSTNAMPPPSTAHLITPPQWEGLPTHQQPRHHVKWNDTRRRWHDWWQHGWPTSSAQQYHPQMMRSAQHHLHACMSTTTIHQHPPPTAMSNHPWTEPPPSTNGDEGPKPPPPPPSNSTHHKRHHHHQPTARRANHHHQWMAMRACLFLPSHLPFNQYFTLPHWFLQEWSHSTGIHRNGTGICRNGTGIHRNGTRIHWNGQESTGMD